MSDRVQKLKQLQDLARLRSDMEMRRFSAFRANVAAAKERISGLHQDLARLYEVPDEFTVANAKLTNALTIEKLHALEVEEQQLQHMMPGFEVARKAAAREFGRCEVIGQLRDRLIAERNAIRQRKTER